MIDENNIVEVSSEINRLTKVLKNFSKTKHEEVIKSLNKTYQGKLIKSAHDAGFWVMKVDVVEKYNEFANSIYFSPVPGTFWVSDGEEVRFESGFGVCEYFNVSILSEEEAQKIYDELTQKVVDKVAERRAQIKGLLEFPKIGDN